MALTVKKRNGDVVLWDSERVRNAALKALNEAYGPPGVNDTAAEKIARTVYAAVEEDYGNPNRTVGVEEIQDTVESTMMSYGFYEAAKLYILYRENRRQAREDRPVPPDVVAAFAESAGYFKTPLQQFQFYDKYSRFNYELGRRETWVETVDRCVDYLVELSENLLNDSEYARIRRAILEMRAMPSMRLLAMAGAPARRNSMAIYNCSYQPIDSLDAFSEALLISMAGCGVGFSVEGRYVGKIGCVAERIPDAPIGTWIIEDSAEGWADALRHGIERWMLGYDVNFDYSLIRPAGAVLRTKGGRASGKGPLKEMLDGIRSRILAREGRQLRPIDCHDMMCMVGGAAVSGGVRRTAMISLFDEDDYEMLTCKDGDFDKLHPYRWHANNSAVRSKSSMDNQHEFAARFLEMVEGGRGEPGIFSRDVAESLKPPRRESAEWGTNPCGEIVLRPFQFCNLSAAIVRGDDTFETLAEKVEIAAMIGTIQSLATNFPGMRDIWEKNCQEERLLGVDITGQMDNPSLLTPENFEKLRQVAVSVNAELAGIFGINPSASVTCVKPSGNTSQLVDCASGLHARWSPYYVRNVRVAAGSPLARVLIDAGAPLSPENGEDPHDPKTWVVSFPVAAPVGAITRNSRSAVEQCEWWLRNKVNWTEHNPSVTITYKPDEVIDLMKWAWDHRDRLAGMAFLPSFDAKYDQLPYIEIDEAEYKRRVAEFPEIDFSRVYHYESDDRTTAAQELACAAGYCEIDV